MAGTPKPNRISAGISVQAISNPSSFRIQRPVKPRLYSNPASPRPTKVTTSTQIISAKSYKFTRFAIIVVAGSWNPT